MLRNTRWMRIGVLSGALVATVAAGCAQQSSNPDKIPGVPVTTATSAPQVTTASAGAFDDAASTWGRMDTARGELDTAIKAGKLDQVHEASAKIRGLARSLPDESLKLPEDKRKALEAHVQNVGELTEMMDKSVDPSDTKSLMNHQTAMNDALDMMKGIYPAGAMRSSMHMPDMNSSGKGMADGSNPMSDDGMSKPADADKTPGMPDDKMADKGMGGMGMMDKMMPGMDKMGDKPMNKPMSDDTMDKMTSGMSAADKNDMKMMMGKMASMPPAERKKAMEKMSGMAKPNAPVKEPAPKDMPMPGGGMGHM